ncbi:ABC transporter ATP-binding protein [Candidatus Xiphinematobacter sp. Idaho Grape]|uniref:ABC transporter ATP-binding protein n=1 Tax=Candidatus Xiphinematobacter sp. Idaho Grape TaxID=1704307 RepID=UPI001F463D86|nr:ABC transporter ATP-binding protein [Candidatus Xiphinematobacter sp. Idaho Grape]
MCGIGFALVNGCVPLIIRYVGEKVFRTGASQAELIHAAESNQGDKLSLSVILICLLIPLTMLTRSVLSYLSTYCMRWVSLRLLTDMRQALFLHLISQSMDFFNQARVGKLISRVMHDTRTAQGALVSIASELTKAPLSVLLGVGVLVRIDWRFSLTTLALLPLCIVPVLICGKKVRRAGREEENEVGAMSVILQESLTGIRMVKGFGREAYQAQLFNKSSEAQLEHSLRICKSAEIVQPLIEGVSACGVSLALMYVYYWEMSAVKFLVLLVGIFLLYEPVKKLSKIPLELQKCLTCAVNIFDLLRLRPSTQDWSEARQLVNPQGNVRFERVSFSYRDGKKALSDISLSIRSGCQYALVGASGAGKTTILSLLLRFYDPQEGHILLDGIDIRRLTQESLRKNIGLVSQDIFLFHDTIHENIRYGRLDASQEEVEEAARLAFAHDFILEQPEGYNTIIGDKGCQLSGGQKQRLSIARAILKDAPILLLDEATAALDSQSERMVQSALERLTRGRTTIAIAHRLSTILNSDEIIVMDCGHLVEHGSHIQLLRNSATYRKLYELQFSAHPH